MQMSSVDAVLRLVRKNRFRTWTGDKPESFVSRRRAGGFVTVGHTPKFRFDRSAAIFTIGSCFARNVERHLVEAGFNVLTADFKLPKEWYFDNPALTKTDDAGHSGALNKYSIATIRSEIDRVVGRLPDIPQGGLIEVEPGQFFDAQASGVKPNALEIVQAVRQRIQAVNARIVEADVVLVTLGTTESWHDTATGLPLNFKPWPALMKSRPERFAFSNMDAAEAIAQLDAVVQTMRSVCRPDTRIVLTVSPVPMGSTWTDMDVVTANTHSKSTLRAAAGVMARRYDYVDYFPAYEIVLASPPEIAWSADNLHVNPDLATFIVRSFTDLYTAPA